MSKKSEYFSLFRLVEKISGNKGETTWLETHSAGWIIYLVSFAFLSRWLLPVTAWWKLIVDLVAVTFAALFAWPVIFLINLFLIDVLRRFGFAREISNRRIQSVLIITLTTALAVQLARTDSSVRFVGFIWLFLVAANLFAFLVLGLIDNAPAKRN